MGSAAGNAVRRLEGFSALTEYECGRAQIAIEWVARAQKPIVEIGGMPISHCNIGALKDDLERCVNLSGEDVRAFIAPSGGKFLCYGFYKFSWAFDALLFAWGIKRAPQGARRTLWLQGLVFGYSPSAIQAFIDAESASCGPRSTSRSRRRTGIDRQCRVEIYGLAVSRAPRRSMKIDRYRTPD